MLKTLGTPRVGFYRRTGGKEKITRAKDLVWLFSKWSWTIGGHFLLPLLDGWGDPQNKGELYVRAVHFFWNNF